MTLSPLARVAARVTTILAAILIALMVVGQILHVAPAAGHIVLKLDKPQATVRLLPDISKQQAR